MASGPPPAAAAAAAAPPVQEFVLRKASSGNRLLVTMWPLAPKDFSLYSLPQPLSLYKEDPKEVLATTAEPPKPGDPPRRDGVRVYPPQRLRRMPWVVEDTAGSAHVGQLEGGQRAAYMVFLTEEGGRQWTVHPCGDWWKFKPKRTYQALTLEQAEAQLDAKAGKEFETFSRVSRYGRTEFDDPADTAASGWGSDDAEFTAGDRFDGDGDGGGGGGGGDGDGDVADTMGADAGLDYEAAASDDDDAMVDPAALAVEGRDEANDDDAVRGKRGAGGTANGEKERLMRRMLRQAGAGGIGDESDDDEFGAFLDEDDDDDGDDDDFDDGGDDDDFDDEDDDDQGGDDADGAAAAAASADGSDRTTAASKRRAAGGDSDDDDGDESAAGLRVLGVGAKRSADGASSSSTASSSSKAAASKKKLRLDGASSASSSSSSAAAAQPAKKPKKPLQLTEADLRKVLERRGPIRAKKLVKLFSHVTVDPASRAEFSRLVRELAVLRDTDKGSVLTLKPEAAQP